MSDTKGTKELIRALNPESELRASIQKEKQFIETSKLAQNEKRRKVIQQGIYSLENQPVSRKKRLRRAIGSLFKKPFPTKRVRKPNITGEQKPRVKKPMVNVPFNTNLGVGAEERLGIRPYVNPLAK